MGVSSVPVKESLYALVNDVSHDESFHAQLITIAPSADVENSASHQLMSKIVLNRVKYVHDRVFTYIIVGVPGKRNFCRKGVDFEVVTPLAFRKPLARHKSPLFFPELLKVFTVVLHV